LLNSTLPRPKNLSFTTSYNGISRQLVNQVSVALAIREIQAQIDIRDYNAKPYLAIWDTGATGSAISEKVVSECNLSPIGVTKVCGVDGECLQNVYLVSLFLPNWFCIKEVRVTEAKIFDVDVLIGMDVINRGDFAVTNFGGKTVFSFRMPSLETIDFIGQGNPDPIAYVPKVGRNSPCPCGSGKKYKHCHGK